MDKPLSTLPLDAIMSPTALTVFEILSHYTVFGWAVLKAQCERLELTPEHLTPDDIERLAPRLAHGVARFTSPAKGVAAEYELRARFAARKGAD